MEKKADTTISNNDIVKRIVLETLADGNTYQRSSIVKKIREQGLTEQMVSDGTITGVIKNFVNNNKIECVKRGAYRLAQVSETGCSIEKKAGLVLTRCKEELEKCCVVNMLDIEEGEMDTVKRIGSTIKILEKEMEKYKIQEREEEKRGKISGQEKVKQVKTTI